MGTQIIVPSAPKHMMLTQTQIEDLICDPPMAAYTIMGEVLDAYQAERLRDYFWVPRVWDSSGFSTGKTRTFFVAFALRCILLEGRVCGVYYQNFEAGQSSFWPYFELFQRKSPIFAAQIGRMSLDMSEVEGKGTVKNPSCWNAYFRNGSHLMMPAPSFLQDARNSASKRFHDLGIDEICKAEASGTSGIDDQLLGRCTLKSFNQDHPLYMPHWLFMSTAEDTLHPSYSRYRDFCREVKKGNPYYSVISYSFKDISDLPMEDGKSFKEGLRIRAILKDMKTRWQHQKGKWLKEGLGIWSQMGRGWYDGDALERCVELGKSINLQPMLTRGDDPEDDERAIYFLGVDVSRGEKRKSDDGSLVTIRARLKPEFADFSGDPSSYDIAVVHAYKVRKADIGQWSGIVHLLNKRFRYSKVCCDLGGGGSFLKPELAKAKQIIGDIPTDVIPITTPDDNTVVVSNPILVMFTNGDDQIMQTWEHIKGADMLKDVAHTLLNEAIERTLIAFPPTYEDVPHDVKKDWSPEREWASKLIGLTRHQMLNVSVAVDADDKMITTRNGAKTFMSRGHDDFCMGLLHCYTGFLVWLKSGDVGCVVAPEDACMGE